MVEVLSSFSHCNLKKKKKKSRVRPKTANELQRGVGHTIELFNGTTLIFDPSDAPLDVSLLPGATGPVHRQKNVAFSFDSVLGPEATQEHVYDKIRDVIPSLLEGFNSSVLAYGQTSAGKTFTMLGDRFKGEGVMVRSMRDLFLALDEQKRTSAAGGKNVEYALSFSYLEVYNEQILDLLAAAPAPVGGLELQDGTEGDVVVLGLSEHKPHSVEEVMSLLERGNANRSQSPTDANETSSRSHAVLQVHVRRTERKSIAGKVKTIIRRSKLSMIDLAGSERAKATVNREVSLRKEGQNINKSLLALGNCINALSQGSNHVPFRDSKLTRLLKVFRLAFFFFLFEFFEKDSLGGNCRTIMIANVSPCISNYEDTYNTLNYAKRAKNIKAKENFFQAPPPPLFFFLNAKNKQTKRSPCRRLNLQLHRPATILIWLKLRLCEMRTSA
jgi:kinesin family protein 18/19